MNEWRRVPPKPLSRQSSEKEKRESGPSSSRPIQSDANTRRKVRNDVVNAAEDASAEKKTGRKARGAAAKAPPDPYYYFSPLSDSYTLHVARNLGKRWKDFAREGLGLSEEDMDGIEVKYPDNLKRQGDLAIQLWKQRRSKPTVGLFIKTLQSAEENSLAEAVEGMAQQRQRRCSLKSAASHERRPSVSSVSSVSSASSSPKPVQAKAENSSTKGQARRNLFPQQQRSKRDQMQLKSISLPERGVATANKLPVDDLKNKRIMFLSKSIPADMEAKLINSAIPFSTKTSVDNLSQIDAVVAIVNNAMPMPADVKETLEKAEESFLNGTLRIITILADDKAEVPEILCSTAVLRYYSEFKKNFLHLLCKCLCESAAPVSAGPHTPFANGWCQTGSEVQDAAQLSDSAIEPRYTLCVRSFWGHNMLRKILFEKAEKTLFHIIIAFVFVSQCGLAIADSVAETSVFLFLMSFLVKAFFRAIFVIPCVYQTITTLRVSPTEWSKWKVQFSQSDIPQLKLFYNSKSHDEATFQKINNNNTVRHVYCQLDSYLTYLLKHHVAHCLFEISLLFFVGYLDCPGSVSPHWQFVFRVIDVLGVFITLLIYHVTFALLSFDMKMERFYRELAKKAGLSEEKGEALVSSWKHLLTFSMAMAILVAAFLIIMPQSFVSRPPDAEDDEKLTALLFIFIVVADVVAGCSEKNVLSTVFPVKAVLVFLAVIAALAFSPTPSTRGNLSFIGLTTGRLIAFIISHWLFSMRNYTGNTIDVWPFPHFALGLVLVILLFFRVCRGSSFF